MIRSYYQLLKLRITSDDINSIVDDDDDDVDDVQQNQSQSFSPDVLKPVRVLLSTSFL